MQSRNPIFARAEGFNGRTTGPAYGNTYPGGAPQDTGYTDPSQWGTGTPGAPGTQIDQGRMTIDTVVQKTGITLAVVVLAAAVTWFLTGDMDSMTQAQLNGLYGLSLFGALGGFALAMANTFKKVISPALVLVYAAVQGVFVGAFSKALEVMFTQPGQEPGGLVIGAVVGTMAAVAGTLAAYKFFNIQVGTKFRKWVIAAGMGFLAVTFLDMILGFFGSCHRLQRIRPARPDHERRRARPRRAVPDPRLRHGRARDRRRCPGAGVVACRLRAHGHHRVHLHRDHQDPRDPAGRLTPGPALRGRLGRLVGRGVSAFRGL